MRTRIARLATFFTSAALALAGCAATPEGDPLESLGRTDIVPQRQEAAMRLLDADATNPNYIKALRKIVVQPGYSASIRNEAWDRLARNDPAALREALELALPKMSAYEWRTEVCRRIGVLGWKDLTQTLVRAWAVPMPILATKLKDRPEYFALCTLWGTERVPSVLYELLLKSDPVKESNLRARCWELLLATGERDRITALLADESDATTDSFILDMRRGSSDLHVIPRNREEILWIRALRTPQRRAFWDAAREAVARLPESVHATLEPRDISIIVAVAKARPDLLSRDRDALFAEVSATLAADRIKRHSASFEGYGTQLAETPRAHASDMTWGDCAAVLVIDAALQDPAVNAHLFDLADRDLADRTSEHGGLLRLDEDGRFELVEYQPQNRGSDVRFEASGQMFEDGYDCIAHVHLHAQQYDNRRYAGPHIGDFSYADATGVNGLVLCFIDSATLNADFYRRGQVVIDLGTIGRSTRSAP
ncbi:MAG: hypothetical protein EXS03_07305 [Phycisphaerales bacterium]|nr:hypothetical protein [Phycisphaerales bacterium]